MHTLFLLSVFILTGVLAWFIAEANERRKYKIQLHALEVKARTAEVQALNFREQCERQNKDLTILRQNLQEAQTRKETAAVFSSPLRKTVVFSILGCFIFGFVIGGTLTAFWATGKVEAKHRQHLVGLDVMARVARMNAEHFKKDFERLRLEYDIVRKSLDDERIEKTIALTKLEIVLENLVADKWGKGFSLDPTKLKQEWKKSNEVKPVAADSRLVSPQVAF